jgi:hypothetical protein
VTQRPTSGVRYVLERVGDERGSASQVIYRGFAHLPDADLPLEVRIELTSGATSATIASPAGRPPSSGDVELEKASAALVRSATKAAVASGEALPRKIVRWREPRRG